MAVFGILTVILALAVRVQAEFVSTNGLLAYYPFNGNANDASGHGNNGAVVGTDVLFSATDSATPRALSFSTRLQRRLGTWTALMLSFRRLPV